MSKTNNTLTLSEKIQLINDQECGLKSNDLAAKYNINRATVGRIIKKKDALREMATKVNMHRKRQRRSLYGNLEDALSLWIDQTKEQNIEITRGMATKKAVELAEQLKVNVYPGSPWIWRWLKRVNLQSKDADQKCDLNSSEFQFEKFFAEQEEFEYLQESKVEICSPEESSEVSNYIKKENVKTFSKPQAKKLKMAEATQQTPKDSDKSTDFNPTEYQIEGDEKYDPLQESTQMDPRTSEGNFETSNEIESLRIYSKPLQTKKRKEAERKEMYTAPKAVKKDYEKHRWLGDLVVTQMEEVHPDDRADFAWEIHKLIRQFQLKRQNSQDNDN